MSDCGDLFQHAPLDLVKGEIRLLEICVGPPPFLEYKIHHFALNDHPAYRAVSYRWGNSPPCMTIQINGLPFEIRENLFAFLQQISRGGTHLYWIDALCIDQSNVLERNQQVQIMSEIYSRASEVFAWLGDGNEDSDFAMDLMKTRKIPQIWRLKFQAAFLELLQRSYWQRVWIIQELMFARQVKILCGCKKIDWSDFHHALVGLERPQNLKDTTATMPSDISNTHAWVVIQHKTIWGVGRLWAPDGQSLSRIIRLYAKFEATDIRDKVYGLLGLVNPRAKLSVNYSNTAEQLCLRVIRKVSQTEKWEKKVSRNQAKKKSGWSGKRVVQTAMQREDLLKFSEMLARVLGLPDKLKVLNDEVIRLTQRYRTPAKPSSRSSKPPSNRSQRQQDLKRLISESVDLLEY